MARQTRQQRRARRQQQTDGQTLARPAAPVRQQEAQVLPAAQPEKAQPAEHAERGGGARRFVGESWAELKKVEWPRQPQLIQGTTVVLIACIVVGVYLYIADTAFKHLVENVFLK